LKKKSAIKSGKGERTIRQDRIALSEVALHKSEESCWIVLNGKVLDVTDYLE
jgi:cytochrome b involved in lipid metabolism